MTKPAVAATKARHLQTMMGQLFPGRWPQLRPMTAQELKATTLPSLKIDEASAKVATGMPGDPPGDKSWPVWAGVIPLRQTLGKPVPDPDSPPGLALPVVRFGQSLSGADRIARHATTRNLERDEEKWSPVFLINHATTRNLERDEEKWFPVFLINHATTKTPEHDDVSIKHHHVLNYPAQAISACWPKVW